MSDSASLFAELQRRNVFRVALAYGVIAWVLAQVTDLAFDNFGSPEWVSKTVLFLLLLGLPLAIFFAWAFELTPEGIKKEKDVDRSQSITPKTGRKIDYLIIGVLIIAVGFLLSDKFQATEEETPFEVIATDGSRISIAVLPFDNRSNREEDEFFTTGIHDDLLTTIAKIGSMKVISRTSVMQYKNTTKNIPQIAKELGVANILEGGVQGALLRVVEKVTGNWSKFCGRISPCSHVQHEIPGVIQCFASATSSVSLFSFCQQFS